MGGAKNRAARPPANTREGVDLPRADGGVLSTTETCKALLAAAAEVGCSTTAARIRSETKWRERYTRCIVDAVALGAGSARAAVAMAEVGIANAAARFTFTRDGRTVPLVQAVETFAPRRGVRTKVVRGRGVPQRGAGASLPEVPLGNGVGERGPIRHLRDSEFLELAESWARDGKCEPSAVAAWRWVYANQGAWRRKLEDTVFVVFGAGAAVGPYVPLLRLGATIAAVDLPDAGVWERLTALAEESTGTVFAPLLHGTSPGADLMTDVPELVAWLSDIAPGKRLVLGSYGYADGANFLRLAMAQDAVCEAVTQRRGVAHVALAYLCSPTDTFVVPEAARDDATRRYNQWNAAGVAQIVINTASRGQAMQANYPRATHGTAKELVVNCFVDQQGPNYAMAKRLQHWRALAARARGVTVSTNVAPAANTRSVTKNALLAAGYGGAQFFPPVYIFPPETANHVMALSLVHDICNDASKAHGGTTLADPNDLFALGAVHGGFWRMPFRLGSIIETAVVAYYAGMCTVPAAAAVAAAVAYKAKL